MGSEGIELLIGGVMISHMVSGGMVVFAIFVQCVVLWKLFK